MTQLQYYTGILSHVAMFLATLALIVGLVGTAVLTYLFYPWLRK